MFKNKKEEEGERKFILEQKILNAMNKRRNRVLGSSLGNDLAC
jgi:hypothetical protein